MNLLALKFSGPDLRGNLEHRVFNSVHQSAFDVVRGGLEEQLQDFFSDLVASNTIIRFKIEHRRPPIEHERFPVPLRTILQSETVRLGDYRITIAVSSGVRISTFQFDHLDAVSANIRKQELKTITKYVIDLFDTSIPSVQVATKDSFHRADCNCESILLVPYISGVWDWALRFICKKCGKSYICNCFRNAFEIEYSDLTKRDGIGTLSNTFLAAYEQSEFREGICHFCQDVFSELRFCHPMYGSKTLVHYGPYIYSLAKEKNIGHREAENEIRSRLGIPAIGEGWVSEMELVNTVRRMFPDQEVVHQASPSWLDRQRFDIFLPGMNLAIEYQGRQHYEPVPFFGGEEGFQKTQERDQRKARLSAENGVSIIYFRYDERVDYLTVKSRIRKMIQT